MTTKTEPESQAEIAYLASIEVLAPTKCEGGREHEPWQFADGDTCEACGATVPDMLVPEYPALRAECKGRTTPLAAGGDGETRHNHLCCDGRRYTAVTDTRIAAMELANAQDTNFGIRLTPLGWKSGAGYLMDEPPAYELFEDAIISAVVAMERTP